ncbi:MAG: nitroreductase family protein [Deltaproteobacteria bacterium]|nr:nitroreductase family protein [Deltaproteobacteria bacterium]
MIDDVLRTRRSVRRFKPECPPREALERLLELAVTAPSASNRQPWRFLVVTDRRLLGAMAEAVRAQVEHLARHVPPASEGAFRAYGAYFTRFEDAPAVIVPLCRASAILSNLVDGALDEGSRDRIAVMERTSAMVSTALALENLLLAAHDGGLGASAMTGPLIASDRLAALLKVPAGWEFVALVPVGYPDEAPEPPGRKTVENITRWYQ